METDGRPNNYIGKALVVLAYIRTSGQTDGQTTAVKRLCAMNRLSVHTDGRMHGQLQRKATVQ